MNNDYNKKHDDEEQDIFGNAMVVILSILICWFLLLQDADAQTRRASNVSIQGTEIVASGNSTSETDTGYTITYETEHKITQDGQTYKFKGTFHIMKGPRGGLYIVVATTKEGKPVKYRNLPKEIKDKIK